MEFFGGGQEESSRYENIKRSISRHYELQSMPFGAVGRTTRTLSQRSEGEADEGTKLSVTHAHIQSVSKS